MENNRPNTFSVHGAWYCDTHCIVFSKSAGYLLASLLTSSYARPQFLRLEYTIVFSNSRFFLQSSDTNGLRRSWMLSSTLFVTDSLIFSRPGFAAIVVYCCICSLWQISFCIATVAVAVIATSFAFGNIDRSLTIFKNAGRNSLPQVTTQWASSITMWLTLRHTLVERMSQTVFDKKCSGWPIIK